MPTQVLGLPLHPLMVHAPIILVPVACLCVVTYVLIPRVRPQLGWLVLVATAVTIPAVLAARWSGQQLATARMEELAGNDAAANAVATHVNHHAQYGDTLIWLVAATTPLAWFFCAVVSGRFADFAQSRSWDRLATWYSATTSSAKQRVTTMVAGTVLIVLAAACLGNVVLAGHTGAAMIWDA